MGSSQPRHQTQVSRIARGFFYQLSHKGGPCVSVKLELNPQLAILTHWHLKTTAKCNDFYLQEITGNIYCFSSVAQWCPTLWDPMNCSMPGFPVQHQVPELTQTHVHQVGDAIQPSHPLLSPSPPISNHSQHQGLFQWVSSLHKVAKVLEFQLQHQSFQWIFRTDFL